ncbi:right-handed parallel beta-helix repeat-containing protein [Geotalea toluenoxydans]
MKKTTFLVAFALCLLIPAFAFATLLTADTTWQGEVTVNEDVIVPSGISLTLKPGTVVRVIPADTTKTDPEYISPLTEITVRGTLKVEGTRTFPVKFSSPGEAKNASWAGLIVDGGRAFLSGCSIDNAETALHVIEGTATVDDCKINGNRYGVSAIGPKSSVVLKSTTVADNDFGVYAFSGAKILQHNSTIGNNRKKDLHAADLQQPAAQIPLSTTKDLPVSRIYHDEVLLGSTIWQGRIIVKGIIRVPEGARLAILPGTVIEFSRRDSNGDGIGENGLMIQGSILAKGSAREPIIFRSAEKGRSDADWDAINIMGSDGVQNLIEYCQIEGAYRGLHFHFSNVAVTHSVLKGNYRAIQFQESLVVLHGNRLYENKSGIQGRNSTIHMSGNLISSNYIGGNFFRCNLQVRQNEFIGNRRDGLRLREGVTIMEENLIDGNRFGLMVADTFSGRFNRNVVSNNAETGLSLKNSDNIELFGNFVANNGLNGVNLQETRAEIKGNQIAANGERGLGLLSFTGTLTGNSFMGNGLWAIDQEGTNDVEAPDNWWGNDEPARVIFDRRNHPSRGRIISDNPLTQPVPFVWPLASVATPTVWQGEIIANRRLQIPTASTLTLLAGTKVLFAEGSGMTVNGKIVARGEKGREVIFTSAGKKLPGTWDEVLLEHANGSVISHAVFEYAQWGLHSHFTKLSLADSIFRNNNGGMRFRSGPVSIKRCLFRDNSIGIRSYRGNGSIEASDITRNETGVFVREKGSGLKINGSNLFDNTGYNVRIGDFNDENVDAAGNWWGEGIPANTIFDGRNEPGIGLVIFEPFLSKRVKTGNIVQ